MKKIYVDFAAILGLLGFIVFFYHSNAQDLEYYKRKISNLDNLPTETIYNLLVDSSGKLWLGTDKGLFFYDGIKFHSVHNENAYQWDISYLKNPTKNEIYAMNFLNQIFLLQNDSLKLLPIPENVSINFNFIDYEVQDSF